MRGRNSKKNTLKGRVESWTNRGNTITEMHRPGSQKK